MLMLNERLFRHEHGRLSTIECEPVKEGRPRWIAIIRGEGEGENEDEALSVRVKNDGDER